VEDIEVDCDNLQFNDMASFIADRVNPHDLLHGLNTNNFAKGLGGIEMPGQFDSFKVLEQNDLTDRVRKFKALKQTTSESFA
jgi:hypothetical protein